VTRFALLSEKEKWSQVYVEEPFTFFSGNDAT